MIGHFLAGDLLAPHDGSASVILLQIGSDGPSLAVNADFFADHRPATWVGLRGFSCELSTISLRLPEGSCR